MTIFSCQCKYSRFFGLAIAAFLLALLSLMPIRLVIAFYQAPAPIHNLPPNLDHPSESWNRNFRDSVRAIFWILTGYTGASLNPKPITPCT
jgi:hypothetical protein